MKAKETPIKQMMNRKNKGILSTGMSCPLEVWEQSNHIKMDRTKLIQDYKALVKSNYG